MCSPILVSGYTTCWSGLIVTGEEARKATSCENSNKLLQPSRLHDHNFTDAACVHWLFVFFESKLFQTRWPILFDCLSSSIHLTPILQLGCAPYDNREAIDRDTSYDHFSTLNKLCIQALGLTLMLRICPQIQQSKLTRVR